MPRRRHLIPCLVSCLALLVAASLEASGEPRVRTFELPDRLAYDAIALTDRSFIVYSQRLEYTPVDRCRIVGGAAAHLVEDVGDRFRTRRLPGTPLPILLRLSPTRLLTRGPGPDRLWDTADDEIVVVDRIGDGMRTRAIEDVGRVGYADRIDDDTAFLHGAEGTLLLRNLAGVPELLRFGREATDPVFLSSTRYLRAEAASYDRALFLFDLDKPDPIALEPLQWTSGFEVLSASQALSLTTSESWAGSVAEPRFRLYSGLDGEAPTFAEYDLPFAWRDTRTARLSADRRLLVSSGPDRESGTADDQVMILDHLLSTPVATAVPVPYLRGSPFVVLSEDAAAIRTKAGPGLVRSDDIMVLLTDLGGTPTVTPLSLGLLPSHSGDPLRLGPRQLAIQTLGVDGVRSSDDEIAIVSDIGGTNLVSHVVVGEMGAAPFGITPIAGGGLLAEASGPDGRDVPTADDLLLLVTAGDGSAAVSAIPVPYARQSYSSYFGSRPELLGNGRALLGPLRPYPISLEVDWGCEAPVQLVDGLAVGLELATSKLKLRGPASGRAIASLVAHLVVPEPSALVAADLTFRIGEVWQTIPAAAWQATETGYRYEDPTGANGFFRLLEYDAEAAELRVEGSGPISAGARFGMRRVVLSLESERLRIVHEVDVVRRGRALVLRKPE